MVESATEPASNTPSTTRLTIRVKLIPQEPPPPARWPSSRGALLLIVGVVAILLGWLGFNTFARRTEDAPVVTAPPSPPPAPEVAAARPVEPPPDPPTATINEVIPDVPKSASDTIRGTIRVSVRVTVDKQGTVTNAVADDRGPSRYFERLAVAAAKQWTFTPTSSEDQRIMLVKFNFTRAGATAQASPSNNFAARVAPSP